MADTGEDIMAEFQRCCAKTRNLMRMSCQECDICYYYNTVDVDKLADSNPWSFDLDEPEAHVDNHTVLTVMAPIPQHPTVNGATNLESFSAAREDSFDDSLIVPVSFHSQVTRPLSESVNNSMFKIGIVQGLSDSMIVGPYELPKRTSSAKINGRKSLSIVRPKSQAVSIRSVAPSTVSVYENFNSEDDEVPQTPTTPDLEPANSLGRASTDSSVGSVSEEELETPDALSSAVVQRQSQLEALNEFHELKAWQVYGDKTPAADTQGTITAFSKAGSIKRAMTFGRRRFRGKV